MNPITVLFYGALFLTIGLPVVRLIAKILSGEY